MNYEIKINKVSESRLPGIDFDNIPFGTTFSDHMFTADYIDGQWVNLQIIPFGPFEISPVNLALHYGQSIFEGMKATLDTEGNPMFFRPEMHARRLNASANRMMMPEFPEEIFIEALHNLIGMDRGWIPGGDGSALYIRPFMFATDAKLGVKVSEKYKFIILTGPVGLYYPKPVKLWVETEFVRAAKGGVGEAKTCGNYAASLYPAKKAMERGYDQILWLDAGEFKYVQEVGTMNVFFVIDGTIITPKTDGAILKGITRDTLIHLIKDKGLPFEERLITIDEVVDAYKAGKLEEAFGTGTAALVSNVEKIAYKDTIMDLPPVETHKIAQMLKNEINMLRNGKLEDKFEWCVPVRNYVNI